MRTLVQLAFILAVSSTAFAQWSNIPPPDIPRTADGKPNLSAPAPRLSDGRPDLSGIWNPPTGYLRNLAKDLKEDVPFQPWAKALYDERAAGKFWREEPDANCLPQGVPKVLLAPAPWQIVQTPKVVFFIHEAFNLWWQAFMDGRQFVPHPDVAPTWHGYSTAKWDGDTLVVESGGFNGRVWLDQLGKPSTEALHVTTKFRRKDFGHMDIGITIDDAKAYTKPFTVRVNQRLMVDQEMIEFICNENERSTDNIVPPAWWKDGVPRQLGPDMKLKTPAPAAAPAAAPAK